MDASPLIRLPSELRNQIYEYVFTYETLTCDKGRWSAKRHDKKCPLPLAREWGPLQVCRQMREETLHLPFSLNTPTCGAPASDPYYEWSLAPPLQTPCEWAVNTMRPALFTGAATFNLHLNIYPEMWSSNMSNVSWDTLAAAFKALPAALGPAKLVVTLNMYYHYESLDCMYPMPFHGIFAFEMCPGTPLEASQKATLGLKDVIKAQTKALGRHVHHHSIDNCRVKANEARLKQQLIQVHCVSRRLVQVAMSP